MQCVILAGGLGTRISERARGLPKALIPVLGRPFVFYQLEWLARQRVDRVLLCVGYGATEILDAVGTGQTFGLTVAFANEGTELRGTGGALRFAADLDLLDPAFFVLYGDSYLPIELDPLWRASECGRAPTMAIMRNAGRWDRSNVRLLDGGLVHYDKFASDAEASTMQYIDYGVSVLTRAVIVEEIAAGPATDLGHVFNRLSLARRLRGHEVFERFYEIGSPDGLDAFEAHLRANA